MVAEVIFRRRRALLVRVSDGSGFLNLRFFYFSRAQQEGLARGTRLRCVGEARRGPQGLEMVHPEYRRLGAARRAARRPADADLSAHRGPDPGPRARAGEQGAGAAGGESRARTCCPPKWSQRLRPAHAARGAGVRASPAGGHVARHAGGRPASRAASPRLRGAAGAPALAAAAEAARAARAAPAAGRCRSDWRRASSPRLPFPLTGAQRRVLDEVEHDLRAATCR